MITDFQCNRVYISSLLPEISSRTCASLIYALDKHDVEYRFLENTNDIWCRDFMPVQVAKNIFCGFDYDPDYLHETNELLTTRTNGIQVCSDLGIEVKRPAIPLRIDGGNVIRCDEKIIMIDKVFKENRISRNELARTIEEHFMAELVILPWDKSEIYGHADGLVRYLGNNRVLITNYDRFDKSYTRKIIDILRRHFDEAFKLEYCVNRQHKHNWAYINWLQTDKVLLIPYFGYPEDRQAFEQITSLMPMYQGKSEMIDSRDLICHEGCLNCASWTIYHNK